MNNINFDNNLSFELIIELTAGINPKAELMSLFVNQLR